MSQPGFAGRLPQILNSPITNGAMYKGETPDTIWLGCHDIKQKRAKHFCAARCFYWLVLFIG